MGFLKIWWDNIFILLLVAVEILHESTNGQKKNVQIQNQIKSTSMQNLDSLWDICHFPTKLIIYV
jgi:hypothetical protein